MRRKHLVRGIIITVCAVAILITGLVLLRKADEREHAESRGEMTEGFGQLRTVEWNGVTYQEKPAVTTILIAGIDKTDASDVPASGTAKYRSGGQADFLLLLGIDHTDKQIHQLQIDRDTIADVTVLGVFGNETSTRQMQICLSHAYGETPKENAKYTVRAVQNLMDGIEIDGYYMFPYSAMPVINDALGGVTVKINFDMTMIHPSWTKGSTVTLRGQEAEDFVRSRMSVGHGTNKERMERQNEFMQNAITLMNRKMSDNLEFGEELLNTMQGLAETNMTIKRLAEEMNKAYRYEVLEIEHPDGEYQLGKTGFVEFHMRENAAIEWVLEHLYTRK